MAAHHTEDSTDPHGHSHPASMMQLVAVFAALIVLTVVTVQAAYLDLGALNLPMALGIATVKATLVALFFMHLTHDSGFNRLAFFGSFLFVTLFVYITLLDSGQYQSQIEWKERVLQETAPK